MANENEVICEKDDERQMQNSNVSYGYDKAKKLPIFIFYDFIGQILFLKNTGWPIGSWQIVLVLSTRLYYGKHNKQTW